MGARQRCEAGRGRAAGRLLVASVLAAGACSDGGFGPSDPVTGVQCSIDKDFVFDGNVGRDGIPALTDPPFVAASDAAADYLDPASRVIGLTLGGEALAIPHNILWHHEIVNLNRGGLQLAVTYCPLTGTSLAFDRAAVGGVEFGVSGLLFQNNLMMYDRRSDESLWPQMAAGARCGPRDGLQLPQYPLVEMRWDAWQRLHPDTRVVSGDLDLGRDYTFYPYRNYEALDNAFFLFPMPTRDRRRPAKERVLGVPDGRGGGRAFPFGALEQAGDFAAIPFEHAGRPAVLIWEAEGDAAMAFYRDVGGEVLTFEASPLGVVDVESGSLWNADGLSRVGERAGERLEPIAEAYVAFWGAWAVFHPDTELWRGA